MAALVTKHFQFSGLDDFDKSLDEQINEFVEVENIKPEDIIDVKYEGHSALGVNTYSALLVYKKD